MDPACVGQTRDMASADHCDSCGDDGVEVVAVRRRYVVPESWDTEGSVTESEETERWCYPCRTHYPHTEVDP